MTGPTDEQLEGIRQASDLILKAGYLVAFVGAGMSVESGIPPFRGPGGQWTRHGEPTGLDYHQFTQDPAGWWERRLREETQPGNPTYEMKQAVDRARPNPGHHALVELERAGWLRYLITQNVDNLHLQAGSINVGEIHGNRTKLRCLECGLRVYKDAYPVVAIPPRCPECGGTMKIDTVMFGEPIPSSVMAICLEEAKKCDCMLLIGTSGSVHPAASLPLVARGRGATLIEINPYPTSLTPVADLRLRLPSAQALPQLAGNVLAGLRA